MGLKKITLKCGDRKVKVLKSVANSKGLTDGTEVSEVELQDVVTENAKYIAKVVYPHIDRG